MHGRVKVKTSAEKAEQKRLERAEKLKRYQEITSAVTELAKTSSWSDEFMSLSAEVLAFNPDHTTIWNIRRKALLQMRKEKSDGEITALVERELKVNC
jgi:geranylgeranyl transferase type-2 subunit alpha